MLRQHFFNELSRLTEKIRIDQDGAISQASRAIADAIANGGCVHLFDTGHLLDSEFIGRAGGMMGFKRFRADLVVESATRPRPEEGEKDRNLEGLMRFALKKSSILPGDVLIIGTVSGKSVIPVDLALAAREIGITVIALTSVCYSSLLKSEHSSGKRLFEIADIVLDNCAPPMDAMVEVPELGLSICPASGISAAIIMWAVTAQAVDNLLARGIKPTIYKSINNPGSAEYNDKEYKRHLETGY